MSTLFETDASKTGAIKPTFANCPILPKRDGSEIAPEDRGWWFGTPWAEWPAAGPYETRKEAEEARSSLVRNWIGHFRPREVVTSR